LAEDKLFAAVTSQKKQASAVEAAEAQQLLELANEELGKKELALREARRKADLVDALHLEQRSKAELLQAHKQMTEALKVINQMIHDAK